MSSKNSNQINVPQAREAMDKFKMQAASEVGVNLTNGYNGHLTSREAGSVGGQMVKKAVPYEPLHSTEQTASHTAIKSPLRMQSTSVHNRSAASITEAAVFICSTYWNLLIIFIFFSFI